VLPRSGLAIKSVAAAAGVHLWPNEHPATALNSKPLKIFIHDQGDTPV